MLKTYLIVTTSKILMLLFLDLYDLPDGVTAAHVAEMHQADLDIEHKYNCRGLT